jgi:iron complex transport system substrate-binding protein
MKFRVVTVLLLLMLMAVVPLAAQDTQAVEIVEVTDTDRLVRHPLGETRVPLNPQRIASLIPGGGVDYFLTYGVVPVAAGDLSSFGWADSARPTYYDLVDFPVDVTPDAISGIGCCGGSYNLEALLAADPDVIIGWDYQIGEAYAEMSAIAPTVAIVPYNGATWIEAGRVLAEVIGRSDAHDAWLETWDATIAALHEQYAAYGDPADTQITILNGFNPTTLRMESLGNGQIAEIVAAAGFSITPLPEGVEDAYPEISLELLPEIDADVILVTTNFFSPDDLQTFQAEGFGASALWQRLDAVQNERVYFVDTFFWTNGGPTVNTQIVLPDLFRAVYENVPPRFTTLSETLPTATPVN